ncbi:FxsA family protein [Terrabacter sp. NPDC080008]|uniref:FxsA family protein n=1 Tax=Terrabacter sp. NPDC080008 TaxID=3155176 RepID=UPI00344FEF48
MTAAPRPSRTRRPRLTRLAVAGLLLLPVIEIVVIVAVGHWIGAWATFLLLVATSLLGAWLIRREGGKAWRELQQAVRSGRMPAREIADGIVVLAGGSLLVIPGFVTDVVGLVLVLPFTRPIARSMLAAVISRRLLAQSERFTGPRVTGQPSGAGWDEPDPHGPQHSSSSDEVVEGEIIDED